MVDNKTVNKTKKHLKEKNNSNKFKNIPGSRTVEFLS
jgi:hypothetical protein